MLALIFVGLMSFEYAVCLIIAYITFVLAAITDYYDGKIARQRNIVTNFGKLLDPVADKVLLVAAFVMMMSLPELRVPEWTVVVIVARELLVTGARSLGAVEGAVIPANLWGKVKTVVQMGYVLLFLLAATIIRVMVEYAAVAESLPGTAISYTRYVYGASYVCMVLVALYTIASGVQFVRHNWKVLGLHQEL